MDINQYISMTSEELIKTFFTEVINHYSEGLEKIEELSKTERYRDDYEFRITIETAKAMALCLSGEVNKTISLTKVLIDTASSLQLWELAARNWNTLGIMNLSIGQVEKSVECFHNVVKIEKKNGLLRVRASAYSNIGSIFLSIANYDRACKYYELAVETLKKGGETQPRYYSDLQFFYANLALAFAERGILEPVPKYLEMIKEIGLEAAERRIKFNYYYIRMLYHFSKRDYEEAKYFYKKTRATIANENEMDILGLSIEFIEKTVNYGIRDEFYEELLLEAEKLNESNRNLSNISLYRELRNYYANKNNKTKLASVTEQYIKYLEKEVDDFSKRQAEAIISVDEMMCRDDDMDVLLHKNTELELIANEAIKHKNSLQKAYHQIDLINKLGKRITSTTKLKEVIQLIYENLSENIPTTVFLLMVKNDEKEDTLDTIFYYDKGELRPNVSVDLKSIKGLVAECYHNNKIISSYDEKYKTFFEEQRISQNSTIKSAIYMPLTVDDEVIGICSVQDRKWDAYTDEKLEFLEKLLPYLSISVNNAIRSRSLEKEIKSHLKTQEELKEANKRLEILSSLDELTQINGRRIFGKILMQLIDKASANETTLSIIMFDIDNFKDYNDNYGHLEGDEVLKKVAKLIEAIVDEAKGFSARFGGEEFIAALVGLNYEETMKLADRIREGIFNLNLPHAYSSHGRVTVSVGVSVNQNINLNDKNEFIKVADNCLYDAKKRGRNNVVGVQRD